MNKRQMATTRSDGFGLVGKEFPIPTALATEVITAAWLTYQRLGAADRSHREIVNDTVYQQVTSEDGFATQGEVILPSLYNTVQENILCLLQPQHGVPHVPLEITDEVKQRAAADTETIQQHVVFKLLSDSMDQFLRDVGHALCQSEITMGHLKRCCYLHTMADQIRFTQQAEELLSHAKDEYLAPIGHSAAVEVTVLSCRHSKEWNTYNHLCITDDGLVVSFFNKTQHEFMQKLTLDGKVKDHRRNWARPEVAETRMNYVRIIRRNQP